MAWGYASWLWAGVSFEDHRQGVRVKGPAPGWFKKANPEPKRKLKRGDVIVEVQQDVVAKPADVVARVDEVREAKRRSVLLLVRQRAGELRFVAVKVDEEE